MNLQCPKCGGQRVQLSNVQSKHGCLWAILFGFFYLVLVVIKWVVGICIFVFYDSWAFLVAKGQGKGYIWQWKKWFSNSKKTYYCHDCGYNFKG